MSNDLADRDIRQRGLVPPARLATSQAVVIGVGAIGRQVALQLAAIGVPTMLLVDPDIVGVENLASQGYWEADIDTPKIVATGAMCRAINHDIQVIERQEYFAMDTVRSMKSIENSVFFACVDNINTRKQIWNLVKEKASCFIDGRMSAEIIRVIASGLPGIDEYYARTLFEETEAFNGACTARSTIYTASIAAGLMINQFVHWLRDMPVIPDTTLNLLSMELIFPSEEELKSSPTEPTAETPLQMSSPT